MIAVISTYGTTGAVGEGPSESNTGIQVHVIVIENRKYTAELLDALLHLMKRIIRITLE